MLQLIIEAHDVLKGSASRAKYDLRRGELVEKHAILQDIIGKNEFESDAKAQSILILCTNIGHAIKRLGLPQTLPG